MMRLLTSHEVCVIHDRLLQDSGGSSGVRDAGGLASAIAQPEMTFGGSDLYPTLIEKAAALGYSLIANHPFIDGNKRVGHAAMETFLYLNGSEIHASPDVQEQFVLGLAAGEKSRADLVEWLQQHVQPL